jgi:hypothetical protein
MGESVVVAVIIIIAALMGVVAVEVTSPTLLATSVVLSSEDGTDAPHADARGRQEDLTRLQKARTKMRM